MHRTRLFALSASLIAFPVVAGAQALAGRTDSVYTWRGAVPARAQLTVRNFNGPIDVRAASGPNAEVRAEKRSGRGGDIRDVAFHVVTTSNGDVMFCSTYRGNDPCDDERGWSNRDDGDDHGWVTVSMTVLVPRGVQVRVATGNGAVQVDHVTADVHAATGNGRVQVNATEGSVRVSTGNGDVEVRDARASVRVSTGNGRVNVTTAEGPVEASTGNGDIDVRMSALRAADGMSFHTGSGSVRVTLPASYNGELEASTGNGEINSDFELKVKGRLTPRRVRATIGSGGPALRLSTGNGRVEIRRGS